jgi:hypothetical protein
MVSNGVLPDFFWISQDTNVWFCCLICHHLLLLSAKNEQKNCVRSRVTCKLAIIGPWPVPHIFIVKLRWLELEGTVKMCSSYRKFEPPRSRNFREKKIYDMGVLLCFDNCTVSWTFVVKIFNPLESSQRLQLLNIS